MLQSFLADLCHGTRALLAQPGFAAAAIITFALGIGANAAVFSVIEGRLLQPLPYPDPERLVRVFNTYPGLGVDDAGVTVPDYLDRRAHASALSDSAIYVDYSFDLLGADAPARVAGVMASPSLFGTLGVTAAIGRTFSESEAVAGNERVVLLSDALWRNAFAADPGIVGRGIAVSGQVYRVVGVMPATFAFPRRDVALWVPFVPTERQRSDAMRGFEFAHAIGRLAPGATVAQLDAQLDAITRTTLAKLADAGNDSDFRTRAERGGFTARARGLHAHLAGDVRSSLFLLQAAVGLLLLTACANVTNLMLIRLHAREHELRVRAALGAGRARIVRHVLVENGLLAGAGGLVGLGVAWFGIVLMRRLSLDGGEHGFGIGIDASVLGLIAGATLFCGLFSGAIPLLAHLRGADADAVRGSARDGIGHRAAGARRETLVVTQLALAVTLLFGSGLLLHSFVRLQRQDTGFDSSNLLSANINLSRDRYRETAQTLQLQERLVSGVRALPGVEAVGVISGMPLSADYGSGPFVVDGGTQGDSLIGDYRIADPGLFPAMGIPLQRGRLFDARDVADAPPVALIDEALARKAFGTRDAVGLRIGTPGVDGDVSWHVIVGVVGSVRHASLANPGVPTFYFPFAQQPTRIFRLAIRSPLSPDALLPQLRAVMATIDPQQPLWDVMTLHERVARSLDGQRAVTTLVAMFAAVALAVCAVGIYGVLGCSVAQRTAEIGVRMALGADRSRIMRWVLGDAGRMVGFGLVIGVAVAVALGHQLRAWLFGIDVIDPATLIGVLSAVALVAMIASWAPARRAASITPWQALRHD